MKTLPALRRLVAEITTAAAGKASASVALTLALSVTEAASLAMLVPLLAMVGIGESAVMPEAVDDWFAGAFDSMNVRPTLGSALALFAGVAALRAILMRWQLLVNSSLREAVTASVRVRLYRALAGAEWTFIVTRQPSEFVNALTDQVGRVGSAAHQLVSLSVMTSVSLVYLGMALYLSAIMTLATLTCAALLAWVLRRSMTDASTSGRLASEARGRLHAAATEHVGSLKTVKSFGATDRHDEVFRRLTYESRDANLQVTAGQTELQQRLEFGSTVLLAVAVYVAHEVLGIATPQLLVLLFVFARLMPRLTSIYGQLQGLATVLPVVEATAELERTYHAAAEPTASESRPHPLADGIRLQGVSFAYLRRTEAPALYDVNLDIRAGYTTAIVGPSGAGKTTLADLLIGLLSPTSGRILVDGTPLTADGLAGWRRQIGYVAQETFLFHDTIRANLLWASPAASDAALWDALRLSAASDFVAALPEGLDTVLGERGVLVSGGERQRLSLARALLRQPRLLVLDEATSSLDSENETRIQQAIEGLHQRMTIVIITHRLSTIRRADLIHVIEMGRVVESGSWDALMARRAGRFRQLCLAQGIEDGPAAPARRSVAWSAQ